MLFRDHVPNCFIFWWAANLSSSSSCTNSLEYVLYVCDSVWLVASEFFFLLFFVYLLVSSYFSFTSLRFNNGIEFYQSFSCMCPLWSTLTTTVDAAKIIHIENIFTILPHYLNSSCYAESISWLWLMSINLKYIEDTHAHNIYCLFVANRTNGMPWYDWHWFVQLLELDCKRIALYA